MYRHVKLKWPHTQYIFIMPFRLRDMCYKRCEEWCAIDLHEVARLDFPISHMLFKAQTECINVEVLKMVLDTRSCIYVRDLSLDKTMYLLDTIFGGPERIKYDIFTVLNRWGREHYKFLNEFYIEDLPEDVKWADLLSIRN